MTDELQKLATLPLDQRGEALETLLQELEEHGSVSAVMEHNELATYFG